MWIYERQLSDVEADIRRASLNQSLALPEFLPLSAQVLVTNTFRLTGRWGEADADDGCQWDGV